MLPLVRVMLLINSRTSTRDTFNALLTTINQCARHLQSRTLHRAKVSLLIMGSLLFTDVQAVKFHYIIQFYCATVKKSIHPITKRPPGNIQTRIASTSIPCTPAFATFPTLENSPSIYVSRPPRTVSLWENCSCNNYGRFHCSELWGVEWPCEFRTYALKVFAHFFFLWYRIIILLRILSWQLCVIIFFFNFVQLWKILYNFFLTFYYKRAYPALWTVLKRLWLYIHRSSNFNWVNICMYTYICLYHIIIIIYIIHFIKNIVGMFFKFNKILFFLMYVRLKNNNLDKIYIFTCINIYNVQHYIY